MKKIKQLVCIALFLLICVGIFCSCSKADSFKSLVQSVAKDNNSPSSILVFWSENENYGHMMYSLLKTDSQESQNEGLGIFCCALNIIEMPIDNFLYSIETYGTPDFYTGDIDDEFYLASNGDLLTITCHPQSK